MATPSSAARRVLTFEVGGRQFGIEASTVESVIAAPSLTRVPQAPAALKGLANVRGRAAPIVAVELLLEAGLGGARPDALRGGGRVIMLGGDTPVGLAVDAVNAIREAQTSWAEGETPATIETAQGPVRLLQPRTLLASAFASVAAPRANRRVAAPLVATETTAQARDIAFLAFGLAGQAYALALDGVREISRAPAEIRALPGADAAMLGLVSLRGRLLPVVSTASVLGLPVRPPASSSRIIVVAVGEAEIGLLADEVRGVVRAPPERVSAAPAILNRSAGEARIDQILRTDAGLVSILAAERVLDEASVASLLADGAGRAGAPVAELGDGAVQRFVIFRLGEETYGLPIEQVDAVIRLPDAVTRVPGAPPFVAGLISHRGQVTPLVDQALRFGAASAPGARRRVIVTHLDGLAAGFIVDAVDQVASIPEAALQETPGLAAGDSGMFDRVASVEHDGRLVLLVDPRQLLDQAERDILRALAAGADASPTP
ncbi:chemotaxis protein CheW [Caulobacter sp. KR2-114]|uniref:chemotaxis protein CheW n=1 Tax=Caulobacter sp. KR2-114 TaxID=3400912 RepID=UPI003C087318